MDLSLPSSATPVAPPIDSARASRLQQRGLALLERGRAAEALPLLQRAAMDPSSGPETAAALARAFLTLGEYSAAQEAVERAILAKPGTAPFLRLRARIRLQLAENTGALLDAADAVLAEPQDADGTLLLGQVLQENGRLADAAIVLADAAQRSPDQAEPAQSLAGVLLAQGRFEEAEAVLQPWAATSGTSALQIRLALARGDAALAATRAEQALSVTAIDPNLRLLLAYARLYQGQLAAAEQQFAKTARILAQWEGGNPDEVQAVADKTGLLLAGTAKAEDLALVFDHWAPGYEAAQLRQRSRIPGVIRHAVDRLLPDDAGQGRVLGPVLDLGCGTGLAAVGLHGRLGASVVGVDVSPAMLALTRTKELYSALREGDVTAPWPADLGGPFALILAADLLPYLADAGALLRQAACHLAPGGSLLFSADAAPPAGDAASMAEGRRAQTEMELRAACAEAGLSLTELRLETLRTLPSGQAQQGWFGIAYALPKGV